MVAALGEATMVEEVSAILETTIMSGYVEILARFHGEIPHRLYRQLERLAEDVEETLNTIDTYEDE